MKKITPALIIIIILLCAFTLAGVSGCSGGGDPDPTPTPPLPPTPLPSLPDDPEPAPVPLADYTGAIEHIFIREVLAWPEVAWTSDRRDVFIANYISGDEFLKILKELHKNDFVLIDLNDVYSDYMSETGSYKVMQNTVAFPQGKKPLVIWLENLNFREDYTQYGFMSRYIIGNDGEVWAEGVDSDGKSVTSQTMTAITILEKFVKDNPDFSHNGAKGCITLTGSRGILGYKTQVVEEETQADRVTRMHEIAGVTNVVNKLKDNGWYFASNTYGNIPLGNTSLEDVQADEARWREEVGSIVGDTKILTYPVYSSNEETRLDGDDRKSPGFAMQYYVDRGYRYFGSFGAQRLSRIKSEDYNIAAVIFDRAWICGTTLRPHREILSRLFDAKDVYDSRRPDYGNPWED